MPSSRPTTEGEEDARGLREFQNKIALAWLYAALSTALVDGRPLGRQGNKSEDVIARLRMTRKYFGTDGIRGGPTQPPMTAAMAHAVGQAAGAHFLRGDHRHRVVIGKDTRLSGYMMETALVAGFTSVGMDVVLVGPMPTPAVAMLTRSMRADLGVMISASHNPFADNGIKLFGPDGYKLSDEDERRSRGCSSGAEPLADAEHDRPRAPDRRCARPLHPFAKSTFPERSAARRAARS